LNTLQYLIVDEILLARVLVQKKEDSVGQGEYTDEDGIVEHDIEPYTDETEYDNNKAQPLVF
jgi:hypothetical protein